MAKDPAILQIELIFNCLNKAGASNNFPEPGALSIALNKLIDFNKGDYSAIINTSDASKFATAAIEMWHRSIHSFLISASLTKSSPIWASVSGYYSSHYSVRAFAHLLGHFQLFKRKELYNFK